MKPSHFHCIYNHNGEGQEIEGGFTNYPDDWKTRSTEQKEAWLRQLCVDWGMPADAEIVEMRLAG